MPEKMLVDTLPAQIIAADLKKNATDMKVAGLFLKNYIWGRKFNYRDYSLLMHRVHISGEAKEMPIDDYLAVHSRSVVRTFDRLMEGRETGERGYYMSHTRKFKKLKPPPK